MNLPTRTNLAGLAFAMAIIGFLFSCLGAVAAWRLGWMGVFALHLFCAALMSAAAGLMWAVLCALGQP